MNNDFINIEKLISVFSTDFEKTLINKDLLDKKEVNWLNDYHETVFHKLKNFLSQDVRKWLRNKTKKI